MSASAPRRRAVAAVVAPLLAVALAVLGVSCSGDDTKSNAVLDQVAPTKADVAKQAGIDFPPSTAAFRLVRISADQIDLTFTVATADVPDFAKGSKLSLEPGVRVIAHASPLWDVAVTDQVDGGESMHGAVKRSAEVIAAGDTSTVRLSLVRS